MDRLFKVLAVFGIYFCSTFGFSLDLSTKMDLQEKWEQKITQLVRTVDSQAQVFVRLDEKRASEDVTETPYLYEAEGLYFRINPEFSKVNVLILTRLKELPTETKQLLRKITKELEAPLVLSLEALPQAPASELTLATPTPVEVKGLDQLFSLMSQVGSWLWAALGMFSFFAFLGALIFIKGKNETSEEQKEKPEFLNQDWLAGYSEESLAAVLSDCYWCEKDAYAAYVWHRIPIEVRKGVVGSTTFLKSYVEKLLNQTVENHHYLEHPYYLNPLSINHSDNRTLTEMVRKHPVLIHKLPPMRVMSLKLTATERVRIELEAMKKTALPDFKTVPAGKERELDYVRVIELDSVAEEEEVIKLTGLSLELKARIPSLQWLCDVSEEKRVQILATFSAKELASAWIGPAATLDVLSKALPESKKQDLMSALKQSHQRPGRQSPVFRRMHQEAIQALRASETASAPNWAKKAA